MSRLMNACLLKLCRIVFVFIFSLVCIFPDHQSMAEVLSSAASSSSTLKNLSVLDQLKQLKLSGATLSKIKEGEKKDSLIILIQDLHCQEEAQINIAKTLEVFQQKLGLKDVFMEGAEGEFDLELLKAFPDHKVRDKVGLQFLKEGYLTGAEYAALRSGFQDSLDLYGVEKRDLYIENLKSFLKVRRLSKELSSEINKIDEQIKNIIEKNYTKEMKELLNLQNQLKEGELKLDEALMQLKVLLQKHGQKLDGSLEQMLEIFKTSKAIQSETIQSDLKKLLDELSHRLKNEELKTIVKWSLEYRLGRMGILEYLTHLKEAYEKNGLSLEENYPGLSHYYKLQLHQEDLKSESIYEELEQKINTLMLELSKAHNVIQEERMVREWGLIKDLIALKATRSGLENIKKYMSSRLGSNSIDIGQKPLIFFERSEAKSRSAQQEGAYTSSNNISFLIQESLHFYDLALARDRVMAENALKQIDARSRRQEAGSIEEQVVLRNTNYEIRTTVLVTGGFHTEGIEKILDEKGISYAVVIPNMHGKVDENIYEKRMQGPYDFENIEFSQKKLASHERTEDGKWTLIPAAFCGTIKKIIAGEEYTQKDEEILVSMWMSAQGVIRNTLNDWAKAFEKLKLEDIDRLIESLKTAHPNTIVTQFFAELEELRGTTSDAAEITQDLIQRYGENQPGLVELAQVWVKKQSEQDRSRVLPRPPRVGFLSSWWMALILSLGACFRPSIAIQSSGEISQQDGEEYHRGMTLLGDIARRVDVEGRDAVRGGAENFREEDMLRLQRFIQNTSSAFVPHMLRKRALEVLAMIPRFFRYSVREGAIPQAWLTPSLFRSMMTIFTLPNQEDGVYANAGVFLLGSFGRTRPELFQANDIAILERFLNRYLPDNTSDGRIYTSAIGQITRLIERFCEIRPDLIQSSLVVALETVLTREYTPGSACIPIAHALRRIQQLNANLIRPSSPAQAALSLPEDAVHHPLPHYQIYLDTAFRNITRNMSIESQHSIALCAYRLLRRYNIEITSENIGRVVHLISEERRRLSQRVVFGPGRRVINIFAAGQEFDPSEITELEIDSGVSPDLISRPFQGGQDKQAALSEIRNSRGPLTIYFNGHGLPQLLALDDETDISPEEMARALVARGDLEEVVFINDSCFSYNFNGQLVTQTTQMQLLQNGMPPTTVSVSSFDQSASGYFLSALQSSHRPHQSVLFGTLFQAEARMNAPTMIEGVGVPPMIFNDMTILVGITPERIQRAFPHLHISNTVQTPLQIQVQGGPYQHPRNIPVLPLPTRVLEVSTVSPASGFQNQNDRGVQSQVEQIAGMAAKVVGSRGDDHAVPKDPATGKPIDLTNEPLLEIPQEVVVLMEKYIEKIVSTSDSELILEDRAPPPSYGKDRHEKYRELLKALQVALQSGTVKVHTSNKLHKDVQATRQVQTKNGIVHVIINQTHYEKIKSFSGEAQAEEILSLMAHELGEQYEKGETPVWLDERLTFVHPEMVDGVEAFIRWSLSGGQEFIPLRVQRYIQECIEKNDQEKLDQLRGDYVYDEEKYKDSVAGEIAKAFSIMLTDKIKKDTSETVTTAKAHRVGMDDYREERIDYRIQSQTKGNNKAVTVVHGEQRMLEGDQAFFRTEDPKDDEYFINAQTVLREKREDLFKEIETRLNLVRESISELRESKDKDPKIREKKRQSYLALVEDYKNFRETYPGTKESLDKIDAESLLQFFEYRLEKATVVVLNNLDFLGYEGHNRHWDLHTGTRRNAVYMPGGIYRRVAAIPEAYAAALADEVLDGILGGHSDLSTVFVNVLDPKSKLDQKIQFLANITRGQGDVVQVQSGVIVAGKYYVVNQLGSGAFATVWDAIDLTTGNFQTGKRIALKISKSREHDQHVRNDAVMLQKVQEGIPKYYAEGDSSFGYFIAMEVKGKDITRSKLYESLRRSTSKNWTSENVSQVDRLFRRIFKIVQLANQAGVFHSDIKPANILYDDEIDEVALIDFGMAKLAERQSYGTSDLFSVGVLLYKLITGKKLYSVEGSSIYFDTHIDSDPFALDGPLMQAIKENQMLESLIPLLRTLLEGARQSTPQPEPVGALKNPGAYRGEKVLKDAQKQQFIKLAKASSKKEMRSRIIDGQIIEYYLVAFNENEKKAKEPTIGNLAADEKLENAFHLQDDDGTYYVFVSDNASNQGLCEQHELSEIFIDIKFAWLKTLLEQGHLDYPKEFTWTRIKHILAWANDVRMAAHPELFGSSQGTGATAYRKMSVQAQDLAALKRFMQEKIGTMSFDDALEILLEDRFHQSELSKNVMGDELFLLDEFNSEVIKMAEARMVEHYRREKELKKEEQLKRFKAKATASAKKFGSREAGKVEKAFPKFLEQGFAIIKQVSPRNEENDSCIYQVMDLESGKVIEATMTKNEINIHIAHEEDDVVGEINSFGQWWASLPVDPKQRGLFLIILCYWLAREDESLRGRGYQLSQDFDPLTDIIFEERGGKIVFSIMEKKIIRGSKDKTAIGEFTPIVQNALPALILWALYGERFHSNYPSFSEIQAQAARLFKVTPGFDNFLRLIFDVQLFDDSIKNPLYFSQIGSLLRVLDELDPEHRVQVHSNTSLPPEPTTSGSSSSSSGWFSGLIGRVLGKKGVGAFKDPGPYHGNGASLNEKEQKIILDEAQNRAGSETTCLVDGVEIKFQVVIYDNDEKTQDPIGQIAREKKLNHAFHLPNPDPAKKTYYIFVSKNAGAHRPLYEQHELSEIYAEMKYGEEVYALEKAKKLPKGYTAQRLFHILAWANDLRMARNPGLFQYNVGTVPMRGMTTQARSMEELKSFMETYINNMSFDLALEMLTEDRSMQEAWATRCFGVEVGKIFIEFEQFVQEMLAKRLAWHYREGTRPEENRVAGWFAQIRKPTKEENQDKQTEKFLEAALISMKRVGAKGSSALKKVHALLSQRGYLIFKKIPSMYEQGHSNVYAYLTIEIATGHINQRVVSSRMGPDLREDYTGVLQTDSIEIQPRLGRWWQFVHRSQEEEVKAFTTLLYAVILQGNHLYENGYKLTDFDPLTDIIILRGLDGDQFIINPNKIVPRQENTGMSFSNSAIFAEAFRSLLFQTLYGSRDSWPKENVTHDVLKQKIIGIYGEDKDFITLVGQILFPPAEKLKDPSVAIRKILERLDFKALLDMEAMGGKVQPLPEAKKEESKDEKVMTFEEWRELLSTQGKEERNKAFLTVLYTMMFKIDKLFKDGFSLSDFDPWKDITFKNEGGKILVVLNPQKIVFLKPFQKISRFYRTLILYALLGEPNSWSVYFETGFSKLPDIAKDFFGSNPIIKKLISESIYGTQIGHRLTRQASTAEFEEIFGVVRDALLPLDPQAVIDIEGPECKLPLPVWAKWLREHTLISREEKFKRIIGLMAKIYHGKVGVSPGGIGGLLMTSDGEPVSAEDANKDSTGWSDLGKELVCLKVLEFLFGRESTDYHGRFDNIDGNIFSEADWKRLEILFPKLTISFRGLPLEVAIDRLKRVSMSTQRLFASDPLDAMFKPSRAAMEDRNGKAFGERLRDLMQEIDPNAWGRLVEKSKSTPVNRLKDIGEPGPQDNDQKVSKEDVQAFIKNAQGRAEAKKQNVLEKEISYQLVIYDDSEKTKDPIGKLARKKGLKNAFHFPAAQAGGVNYVFVSKKALHEDPAQNQQAFYEWHEITEIYIRQRFGAEIEASKGRGEISEDFTLERVIHILAWALDIQMAMAQAQGNFGGELAYRGGKGVAGRSLEDLLKFVDAQIAQKSFEVLPGFLNEDRREQLRIIGRFLPTAFESNRQFQDDFRARVAKRIKDFYQKGWDVTPPTRLSRGIAWLSTPTPDRNRAFQVQHLVEATLETMAGRGSEERDELMSLYPELVKNGYAPVSFMGSDGTLAYQVINLKTGALEFVMRTPPQNGKKFGTFYVVEKIVDESERTSLKDWFFNIPKEERAKKLLAMLYRLSLRIEPLGNEGGRKLRASEVRVDKEGNPYYEGEVPHPESFRSIFEDLLYDGNPPESFSRFDLGVRIKTVFGETFGVIPPGYVTGDDAPSLMSVRCMDLFESPGRQLLPIKNEEPINKSWSPVFENRFFPRPPKDYRFPEQCALLRGMLEKIAPGLPGEIDQKHFYVGKVKKRKEATQKPIGSGMAEIAFEVKIKEKGLGHFSVIENVSGLAQELKLGYQAQQNDEFQAAFPNFGRDVQLVQRLMQAEDVQGVLAELAAESGRAPPAVQKIEFREIPEDQIIRDEQGLPIEAGSYIENGTLYVFVTPGNAIGAFHEIYEMLVLPLKANVPENNPNNIYHTLAALAETGFEDDFVSKRFRRQLSSMSVEGLEEFVKALYKVEKEIKEKFPGDENPHQVYALNHATALSSSAGMSEMMKRTSQGDGRAIDWAIARAKAGLKMHSGTEDLVNALRDEMQKRGMVSETSLVHIDDLVNDFARVKVFSREESTLILSSLLACVKTGKFDGQGAIGLLSTTKIVIEAIKSSLNARTGMDRYMSSLGISIKSPDSSLLEEERFSQIKVFFDGFQQWLSSSKITPQNIEEVLSEIIGLFEGVMIASDKEIRVIFEAGMLWLESANVDSENVGNVLKAFRQCHEMIPMIPDEDAEEIRWFFNDIKEGWLDDPKTTPKNVVEKIEEVIQFLERSKQELIKKLTDRHKHSGSSSELRRMLALFKYGSGIGATKTRGGGGSFSQGFISNETVGEDLNSALTGVKPTKEIQIVGKTVSVMFDRLGELVEKGEDAASLSEALNHYITTETYKKGLSDRVKEALQKMRLVVLGARAFVAVSNKRKENENGISFAHMGYQNNTGVGLPSIYIGRDVLEYLAKERPELLSVLLRIEVERHRWRSENNYVKDERTTQQVAETINVSPTEFKELNKILERFYPFHAPQSSSLRYRVSLKQSFLLLGENEIACSGPGLGEFFAGDRKILARTIQERLEKDSRGGDSVEIEGVKFFKRTSQTLGPDRYVWAFDQTQKSDVARIFGFKLKGEIPESMKGIPLLDENSEIACIRDEMVKVYIESTTSLFQDISSRLDEASGGKNEATIKGVQFFKRVMKGKVGESDYKIVWAFNKTQKNKVAKIFKLKLREESLEVQREIPLVDEETQIDSSVDSLQKFYVGERKSLARKMNKRLNTESKKRLKAGEDPNEVTIGGVQFLRRRSKSKGNYLVWAFDKTQKGAVADIFGFELRKVSLESQREIPLINEETQIACSGLELVKFYFGNPNELAQTVNGELNSKSDGKNVVRIKGVQFFKRRLKDGKHVVWAFNRLQIKRVAEIFGFELREHAESEVQRGAESVEPVRSNELRKFEDQNVAASFQYLDSLSEIGSVKSLGQAWDYYMTTDSYKKGFEDQAKESLKKMRLVALGDKAFMDLVDPKDEGEISFARMGYTDNEQAKVANIYMGRDIFEYLAKEKPELLTVFLRVELERHRWRSENNYVEDERSISEVAEILRIGHDELEALNKALVRILAIKILNIQRLDVTQLAETIKRVSSQTEGRNRRMFIDGQEIGVLNQYWVEAMAEVLSEKLKVLETEETSMQPAKPTRQAERRHNIEGVRRALQYVEMMA